MKKRTSRKVPSFVFTVLAGAVLVTAASAAQLTSEQLAALRARAKEGNKHLEEITEKLKAAVAARAATRPPVDPITAQRAAEAATWRASRKQGTYYSMQLTNPPPMPFNPFPERPLYDIGGGKFVYDDRGMDYAKMHAEAQAWEEANRPATQDTGGTTMSLLTYEGLSLGIIYDPPSGFLLDVFNMTPGAVYGIGAKDFVDPDPFNTWTLVDVFQAEAANEEFEGTATAPTRFYTVVNLDEYVGPTVSIESPAPGATVNGDVPLQIRVTDILPLTSVKVYVGGVLVGVIQAGQNGLATLPTSWFPNGQHEIWVAVVNEGVPVDTDGDSVTDDVAPYQGGASVTLNFANDVSMQNYSPLYSAAGSLTLQYSTTSPQSYTFEVFRLDGELLHTASGQSVNGSISRQWNFTDLSGQHVDDAGYVFSLTPSAGRKILTTNFVDHGVTVGKYVISYGECPNSSYNNGLANMNAYVSVLVNWAAYLNDDIIGSGREAYNTVHADFSSDPFPIRQATQINDLLALTNALKNPITGSWLFDGHSSPNDMIPGTDHYLTVRLRTKEIAALLGNAYGFVGTTYSVKYGRRLFSTMITGCNAAMTSSEFPDATGTPSGVDQFNNSQIKKTAFVGFAKASYGGPTKHGWIDRLHYEWIDGEAYDTEITTAVWRAGIAYPEAQSWEPTVFGYGLLAYNADESR
ncbi:MAG: hypothetical protein HZA90_25445 [Verrucomicrobia bacterium]|nr:hypothetical protein [Verrucomicrobiota bacterium]